MYNFIYTQRITYSISSALLLIDPNCTAIGSTLKEAIAEISNQCGNGIGINLTTIHGAKGLEADRVFHLRPDLVPHPYAVKPWEIEQENNLLFVALTRAKKDLFVAK